MNINHLKTLLAIVDHGTFGAAANAVFLTQSAVSQQVQLIEEAFGMQIFDRSSRPFVLTSSGVTLVEGARKIVEDYESLKQKISGEKLSGRIAIGAIRASFKGAFPKALKILRNRYPNLQIHVYTSISPELTKRIANRRLDAAIVPSDTILDDNLCWLPYTIEPLMVLAEKDTKGSTDKEILEQSTYIKYCNNSSVAQITDSEILRRRIKVRAEIHSDTLDAVIRMVEQGLGISVLPQPVGGESLPENIRTIPFGDPPLKRQLGIIHLKSSTKSNIITALHTELFKLSGSPSFSQM